MAKINLKPNEYPDIVIAYLFDKVLHHDEVATGNELFDEFMTKMKSRGITPLLRDYYLSMDPDKRRKYKLIKDAFAADTLSNAVINIRPEKFDKLEKEKKKGFFKRVMKKLVMSKDFSDEDKKMLMEVFEQDG
jgi:hypothetical protein